MELKINNEFKKLIPPLTPEEYRQLEENIIKEGCRDPLVIWKQTIIDGHNRLEICRKHDISFKFTALEFEGDDAVKVWMIDNQKGRRNLTDGWKYELAQTKKELLLVKGRENIIEAQKERHGVTLSTIDKDRNHNTQNEIAKELGWSTGKVAMADKVWKDAKPEVKEKIKSGETTFNQAYQEVKKEQKREVKERLKNDRKKQIETISDDVFKPKIYKGRFQDICKQFEDNSIDHIITDPPYPKEFLPDWSDLSEVANRILKPGGFCICYSGKSHLPEVINRLGKHLKYYWQLILLHKGQAAAVHPVKINTLYKPIFVFYKEPKKQQEDYITDLVYGSGREKFAHEWQQAEDELKQVIDWFTLENDLILDPFAGSGTTGFACMKNKRRSILIDINDV